MVQRSSRVINALLPIHSWLLDILGTVLHKYYRIPKQDRPSYCFTLPTLPGGDFVSFSLLDVAYFLASQPRAPARQVTFQYPLEDPPENCILRPNPLPIKRPASEKATACKAYTRDPFSLEKINVLDANHSTLIDNDNGFLQGRAESLDHHQQLLRKRTDRSGPRPFLPCISIRHLPLQLSAFTFCEAPTNRKTSNITIAKPTDDLECELSKSSRSEYIEMVDIPCFAEWNCG